MKYSIFLLTIFVLFSCSESNQKKAEKAVDRFLYETLNDYKSLETISFSELDSLWDYHSEEISKIEEKKEAILDLHKNTITTKNLYSYKKDNRMDLFKVSTSNMDEQKVKQILNMTDKDILPYSKTVDSIAVTIEFMDKQVDSLKSLKPKFVGFTLLHKFRAKNQMGGNKINEFEYLLDKDLNNVITYKEK